MLVPVCSETSTVTQCSMLHRLSTLGLVAVKLSASKLHQWASLTPSSDADPKELALKASILDTRTLLGPFSVEMLESMETWLDQGLHKVLVDVPWTAYSEFEQVVAAVSELPATRVMLRLHMSLLHVQQQCPEVSEQLRKLTKRVSGIVFVIESPPLSQEDGFEPLIACLQTLRTSVEEEFFFAVEMTTGPVKDFNSEIVMNRIKVLHHMNIHVVASGYCHSEEEEVKTSPVVTKEGAVMIDAAVSFVQCLRTDRPDGLFTTVVVDEAGVALGLVYSSAESIVAAVSSGCGIYYSRSRGGLWKKGESSGNAQQLIQIDMDCDSDALRFMVTQTGAGFCHRNTRTCWGQDRGLRALEKLLVSRFDHAPAGSYTKRLFDDTELLRNKLVEEAQELAEAETVPDVAGEAADVMYFAMVRCVAAGCKLADVEKMLDKRALKVKRRPGNAKAYRISAAERILGSKDDARRES